MLRKMVAVTALPDYALLAEYADGEKRIRHMKEMLYGPVFEPLKDPAFFATVHLAHGAPTWVLEDGYEVDLCPDAFYADSQPYEGGVAHEWPEEKRKPADPYLP